MEFDTSLIGDIVIAKDINSPLYNLAAVVDDFEMKISHVIRGEEHISNTPKQILLQEALSFPQPFYAHLPLILGQDKAKLSKRHGSFSVNQFKEEGYLPESLINFMAFLGWNPGNNREIYPLGSLVKEFSLKKVQKSGAIFNIKKLDFINGFYIRQHSLKRLTEMCLPYLSQAGLVDPEKIEPEILQKIVSLYQARLKKLSEIIELTDFFFQEKINFDKELLRWKDMTDKEIIDSLEQSEKTLSQIEIKDWNKSNLELILMAKAEKMPNRGNLLWPLRVAMTGKKSSAGPFEIAEILGKDKVLERIREAKKILN
jgi:glutamyl-tRNA synthetase